jgi:E3 ubiquitin-protein ligase makorin
MPDFKPKCQFGNSCHYSHTHPVTSEPYIFSQEELHHCRRSKNQQYRARILEQMRMMEMLFSDLGVGYESDEEWGSEMVPDDNELIVDALYESGFLGISDGDFDAYGYDYGSD